MKTVFRICLAIASVPTLSSYANAQALTRLCFQTGTSVQSCQTVTATNPLPTTATLSASALSVTITNTPSSPGIVSCTNCGATSVTGPFNVTITNTPSISQLGVTTLTQSNVTVTPTNTFFQALASNTNRKGCTVQYTGPGTKGYITFISPGNTATAFQLAVGQTFNCAIGGIQVDTDAVYVAGTGNDIFVFSQQ